ncbi:LysR family transcriptional regulator [Pseudonocardia sp. CA-107938]|uniref:LysR family transcriptional regulator n=1 Tax=Pseudonocardia sp. CA-107938 TaxID=3240021 RepID=UPI003D8AF12D
MDAADQRRMPQRSDERRSPIDGIELRDLRVFLAVADELHFGRAAARLGLTSSRVSQTIAMLERRFGGRLFDRSSRRVVVSTHGRRVRELVEPAYLALLAAMAAATDPQRSGVVRVGMVGPAAGGPRLPQIAESFERSHPGCRVEVVDVSLQDPLGPLLRRELDLLAARLPLDVPGVVQGPLLTRDSRMMAVAADHPLARRGHAVMEDLGDYAVCRLIGFPEQMVRAVIPERTPAGRPVRVGIDVTTTAEAFAAVARGQIVHPTVSTIFDYHRQPGVVLIPIADGEPSCTALMHLVDVTPVAQAFLREVAAWTHDLGEGRA